MTAEFFRRVNRQRRIRVTLMAAEQARADSAGQGRLSEGAQMFEVTDDPTQPAPAPAPEPAPEPEPTEGGDAGAVPASE